MPFGQLGDIQFNYFYTPERDSFTRSKSANIATHSVSSGKSKVEPVSLEPDSISFRIRLDYIWLGSGVAPYQEVRDALQELESMHEKQEPVLYAIGEKIYGDYLITDMQIQETFVTNDGILETAVIDLTLLEVV